MKRIVAIAITASALLAGPDMGTLIDYDAQDDYIAQTEEAEQYIPAPIVTPIVTAPIVVAPMVTKKSCCSNRDSVDLMGGYNFTEDSGALDDAATVGIRYNKNIAPNTYIQFGYDRVFNADYRKHNKTASKAKRESDGTNSNDNGSNGSSSSSSQSAGTQLDRFYLNGLYEFCGEKRLTPYVFAGLGYENVRHEAYDLESGGFVDAGAGVKYQLNEDLNLITEAKALKKFDNNDLDIVASLGIGIMLGGATSQITPISEIEIVQQTPDVIPSIIPEVTPLATYDNLDVVPIKEEREFNTRAILNEPSHAYNNYDVVPIEEEGRYTSTALTNDGDYYIQVAALFNSTGEDSSYFIKLDAAGLNHQIKETTIRGRDVKLLLVGPYNSDSEARADLQRTKSIEKGAFVKKING
jgi:hypothetical protein